MLRLPEPAVEVLVKDLTQGAVSRLLIGLAIPIAAGMIFQTLYFLIDLFFVSRLGDAALAGVGSGGNVSFVILALTQMLGVGTVALVSQAVGRKDQPDANLIFNQSVGLSAALGIATLVIGYPVTSYYMHSLAADAATASAGTEYLYWYMPGLALQFAMVAMSSALRGTGIVQPTMVVQMLTVVLNAVLTPILIAGWGTGHPLGVAGAGLASTLSVAAGVICLWLYFVKLEHYVALDATQWRPRMTVWRRLLAVGLPAGGEFFMIFLIVAVIYWTIRGFGPAAQAGFGVASRVMQALFLPAMALAFAASPLAGQNFGAGRLQRVRETFRVAASMSAVVMLGLSLLCQWRADFLIHLFTADPAVIAVGGPYLKIMSWNFLGTGVIFTCSSLFQGLGNTWPSFLSSATRIVTYVLPAIWLGIHGGFELRHLWYLSVTSILLQMIFSLLLLRQQFRQRLVPAPAVNPAGPSPTAASS